jgi:hypothetical protein
MSSEGIDSIFLGVCLFIVGIAVGSGISSTCTEAKYRKAILEGKIEIAVSTNKEVKIKE